MAYILLIIGFVLLIKGADLFVDGASKIATALRVSPLIIGLTIVAFGTSAPEATVSIVAALEGSAGVTIGNVVGSNIFNITLVVGIGALILPMTVESETIRKEIPFTLLAGVVALVMVSDISLNQSANNIISRGDGFILLFFFAIFLYYIFEVARKGNNELEPTIQEKPPLGKNIIFTVIGLVAIVFGGDLVVDSASEIALSFGMSETLVGLTIVAVGTSLPELITTITAALKKQTDIALGNIVGSNIFNLFLVLGATAVISPLSVDNSIFFDIMFMNILTLILLIFSRTNYKIGRLEGGWLTALYVLYMVFILIRN
ncbi:calcium/sodium antiporter [Paraliobacillus salinarum]|uniref:calcium/sodium antiporter n=1 Tax=Paraliobacillus salinarum TaxID=1158996 RepID=UPI0015F5BB91|nr:calcium/sodium antiporter [Paraliobacillus salinarum]